MAKYKDIKFSTEACLNVYAENGYTLPVESLYELDNDCKALFDQTHIYAILCRPKYRFNPDSIVLQEYGVQCDIVDYKGNHFMYAGDFTIIKGPKAIDYKQLTVRCNSTCTKLIFEGLTLLFPDAEYDDYVVDVDEILALGCRNNNLPYEYEVLYIGQAQGRECNRGILERLENHKTLQKIVIDNLNKFPENRLYIMAFEFAEQQILSISNRNIGAQAHVTDDKKHFDAMVREAIEISTVPPEERIRQVINITEAAMIHYFKPIYNERLTNNFPSPRHTSYKRYYDLEYNMVNVDLCLCESPQIVLKTMTNKIESVWEYIQYELFKDGRCGIFDIFERINDYSPSIDD